MTLPRALALLALVVLPGCASLSAQSPQAEPARPAVRRMAAASDPTATAYYRFAVAQMHARAGRMQEAITELPADRLNVLRETARLLPGSGGASPGDGSLRFLGNVFREGPAARVITQADPNDQRAIVDAVAGLGRRLSLRIVAEGIETQAALSLVRAAGCDAGQGYLISRPLDVAAFDGFLARESRPQVRVANRS